jgi:hypothetical protein
MLSVPGLIHSTAQMEVNYLESLGEGSVVHFWVAFTVEVSLLCILGATGDCRQLSAYRLGRFLLAPQALQFVFLVLQVSKPHYDS